ncbi:MAG: Calx-beta domain-containing protein [Gloeotrichia echinulata GP01]
MLRLINFDGFIVNTLVVENLGIMSNLQTDLIYSNLLRNDLIINEFSQGSTGAKEWVEILVVTDKLNLQNVKLIDGTGSLELILSGVGFKSLKAGTLIVLYNGGDRDGKITPDLTYDPLIGDYVLQISSLNNTGKFAVTRTTGWNSTAPAFNNSADKDIPSLLNSGGTTIFTYPRDTTPRAARFSAYKYDSVANAKLETRPYDPYNFEPTRKWPNWSDDAPSTAATPGAGYLGDNTDWIRNLRNVIYTISTDTPTIDEGNSGRQTVSFTVYRGGDSEVVSTVNYAFGGRATFGDDYDNILIRSEEFTTSSKVGQFIEGALSGTLNFQKGERIKTITVDILGDQTFEKPVPLPGEKNFDPEKPENITVTLSNATASGRTTKIITYDPIDKTQNPDKNTAQANIDIINDDNQPTISISDVSVKEGNIGIINTNANFAVTLSNPSYQKIMVNYNSSDGTAKTSDLDYIPGLGTIIFNPGETQKNISIGIKGDNKFEANETFFVTLYGATNATIADDRGVGTILNDDRQAFSFGSSIFPVVQPFF